MPLALSLTSTRPLPLSLSLSRPCASHIRVAVYRAPPLSREMRTYGGCGTVAMFQRLSRGWRASFRQVQAVRSPSTLGLDGLAGNAPDPSLHGRLHVAWPCRNVQPAGQSPPILPYRVSNCAQLGRKTTGHGRISCLERASWSLARASAASMTSCLLPSARGLEVGCEKVGESTP